MKNELITLFTSKMNQNFFDEMFDFESQNF